MKQNYIVRNIMIKELKIKLKNKYTKSLIWHFNDNEFCKGLSEY